MLRPARGFHDGRCLPSCQDTQPKAGVRKVKEGEAPETDSRCRSTVATLLTSMYILVLRASYKLCLIGTRDRAKTQDLSGHIGI